jgi:DNA-binding response OmpR family regulator
MLTARTSVAHRVEGLDAGADDYLVKPFALKEVEARLTALHKRHTGKVTSRPLEAGALYLDPRTLVVRFAGQEIKLPPKCIRLLEVLMGEPGRVFGRKDIEAAVWGEAQETSDTLRSHMHILRRTLVQAGGYDPVETVHGMGYRINPRA